MYNFAKQLNAAVVLRVFCELSQGVVSMHIKIYNKHTHTHTIAYNWISFSFFVVRFCCYFWRQYCYDSILIDDTHSVCSSQHDSKFEIVRKFVCLMLDLMALVYFRSVRFGLVWFGFCLQIHDVQSESEMSRTKEMMVQGSQNSWCWNIVVVVVVAAVWEQSYMLTLINWCLLSHNVNCMALLTFPS